MYSLGHSNSQLQCTLYSIQLCYSRHQGTNPVVVYKRNKIGHGDCFLNRPNCKFIVLTSTMCMYSVHVQYVPYILYIGLKFCCPKCKLFVHVQYRSPSPRPKHSVRNGPQELQCTTDLSSLTLHSHKTYYETEIKKQKLQSQFNSTIWFSQRPFKQLTSLQNFEPSQKSRTCKHTCRESKVTIADTIGSPCTGTLYI